MEEPTPCSRHEEPVIKNKLSKAQPKSAAGPTSVLGKIAARFPAVVPMAVALLCLLPFLNRAFSMDDPLFIWMAKHILGHPADPYGFSVNWYGVDHPMSFVMKNPPLNSYYIAAVSGIVGMSEVALHLAFLLPAIAAVLGTYLLARRLCGHPVEATLVAVLTPVFLICSSTVMCDTMMLAFWVWSVFLWVKGLEENRSWMLALSCVLIAACALTKYYGAVLIPLLLAYSIISKRRLGWWLLHFLIPVAILAAYEYWTRALYGRGLLLDAFWYAREHRPLLETISVRRDITALAFTGGCIAGVIFHAHLLWTRKALMGWIGLIAVLAAAGITASLGSSMFKPETKVGWMLILQLALFTVSGLSLVVLACKDYLSRRNADSALLFLWFMGVFAFAGLANWTMNGRALLPMAPVAGILIVRRIEQISKGKQDPGPSLVWPLILSAGLALIVAHADCRFANSQRMAASVIYSHYNTGDRMWFEGHWGFQYYMQTLGADPFAFDKSELKKGDVLVTPAKNTNAVPIIDESCTTAAAFPVDRCLSTMSPASGTGFHSDVWGPVPFAFGSTAPEIYYITPVNDANFSMLRDVMSQLRQQLPPMPRK